MSSSFLFYPCNLGPDQFQLYHNLYSTCLKKETVYWCKMLILDFWFLRFRARNVSTKVFRPLNKHASAFQGTRNHCQTRIEYLWHADERFMKLWFGVSLFIKFYQLTIMKLALNFPQRVLVIDHLPISF